MTNDSEEKPATATNATWATAILIAGLLGWLGYSFPPKTWRIPDSMANIGPLSPPAEQAKLAAKEYENLWKNTLLKFGLAGAGIGLVGIFVNRGSNWGSTIVTLLCGAVAGLAAGSLGLMLRRHLDLDHPLPLISAEMRPLVADSAVFALVSVLLLVPVAVFIAMRPDKSERHKAAPSILAGVLTGLLVPVSGAFLFPEANLSRYPLDQLVVTAFWFAALALFTVLLFVFSSPKKPKTQVV
ncbi:MAG: hypothetical protein R3C53_02135 [Pirellulaceae bacterium]